MPRLMPDRQRAMQIGHLILAVVSLLFCLAPTLNAQEGNVSVTVGEYRAALLAARNDLLNGADLDVMQADLAEIEQVRLENGEVLTLSPLLDGAPDVESALRRLATVLEQMELSSADRTDTRLAQLQTVRDRYNLDRPSFWDRVWRWLSDLFDALTPDSVPSGAGALASIGSRLVVWLIVLSGGALLAIVLSYWLRNLLGGILNDRLHRRRGEDGDIPATASEARAQAQTFAGDGNYRAAVRQLYLAALLHLDEQGLLRFQEDQTNREVLAQTKRDTHVYAHLKPAVETFDRVWYGEREPDRPTFESYSAEIDELMTQTREDDRG
ncbi:MAG: DUF4129 domain-containing protein [Caldilineaceae bacterium]|nr:DUF4129 domain-containing protein [Caldilineaceae bacterium]